MEGGLLELKSFDFGPFHLEYSIPWPTVRANTYYLNVQFSCHFSRTSFLTSPYPGGLLCDSIAPSHFHDPQFHSYF